MNVALWVLQSVIAVFFAMAGARHIFTPRSQLVTQYPWVAATPPWFLRFVGVAEVLGAVGLVLPMALSIVPRLSVAAAVGLALVMGSASVFHRARKEQSHSLVTLVIFLLVVFVAVGRIA
jgi:putative oxidoreductase